MNGKKAAVPDAWDDDWEEQVNKLSISKEPEEQTKLTKAERKAQHVEANKQLWEAAETPSSAPIFVATRTPALSIKPDFKPQMKVLSRKPTTTQTPEDDEDSEEERRQKAERDFAERQARAQREREEKQRKYQEVRERLFGSSASGEDKISAPASPNEGGGSRNSSRGKGRGRGKNTPDGEGREPTASSERKQLFDPTYTAKPNSTYLAKREGKESGGSGTSTPIEEKPIRAPRGPDNSGRGGFGFAPRGNKSVGPS